MYACILFTRVYRLNVNVQENTETQGKHVKTREKNNFGNLCICKGAQF